MRLLLLVFKLAASASLLGLTIEASAAAHLKKVKEYRNKQHAIMHNHANDVQLMQLNHACTMPSDVWERIRMGMQTYSLTDKFVFQSKGKIILDTPAHPIDILLKSSAVQVRLYKIQRHNISILKKLLKQRASPAVPSSSEWHSAGAQNDEVIPSATIQTSDVALAENDCTITRPAAISTPTKAGLIPMVFAQNVHVALGGASDKVATKPRPKAKKMPILPAQLHASHLPYAAQVRLYKLQRYNIDALKSSLKQFEQPGSDPMPEWHTAQLQIETKRVIGGSKHRNVNLAALQPDATKTTGQQPLTRVNYSLKLPNPLQQKNVHERVNKQIAWFVKRPEYLQLVAERAKPYLFHIVEELSKHQLPLELALLPIVESAYKPTALSPMSAAGLWQFIPSTGRHFNLKQDGVYDERLDVTASTQAAIRYFSTLNKRYKGDWLLALAAYNCGEGNVDAAIRRNLAKGLLSDYWSLSLPEETQNYVPRLLALASIFANPAQYRLKVQPVKNEPYFVKVNIEHKAEFLRLVNKDLKTVAEMANISFEQFSRLNPGYLSKTLAKQGPFSFILPVNNAHQLRQKLDRLANIASEQQESPPFLAVKFEEPLNTTANILESKAPTKPEPI